MDHWNGKSHSLCLEQKQRFDLSAVVKFKVAVDRMVPKKTKRKAR